MGIEEKRFTIREAAAIMKVSMTTLYAMCAARKIRHERVGMGRGKVLIPESAIADYRQQSTLAVGSKAPPVVLPQDRPQRIRFFGRVRGEPVGSQQQSGRRLPPSAG